MKSNYFINKTILSSLLCLFFLISLNLKAQDQLKLWSLPPDHQLDFPNSSLQSYLNGNYPVTPQRFHNMMHKADGTPWFSIVDYNIVDESGNLIGDLSSLISTVNLHYLENASEVAIVPIPNTVDQFYIICPGFYFVLEMCPPVLLGPYQLNPFPNAVPSQQALHYANGIAVSDIFGSGANAYHLLFLHDTEKLYIYKIEQSGITLLNQTTLNNQTLTNDLISEMECGTLSNGNSIVAFALPHAYTGGGFNPPAFDSYELWFYEVDNTGNIVTFNSCIPLNTIPWNTSGVWQIMTPKGLEFSPSGNTFYYAAHTINIGYTGSRIFYIDLTSGINLLVPSDAGIGNDEDFERGMIETGYDGNLYFHGGDRLARLTNPDQPLSANANFANNAYPFNNPIPFCHYDPSSGGQWFKNIYSLPDQIDGFNYDVAIGNTTPLQISPTSPVSSCAGGTVTLDAGFGYSTYTWSIGATTQTINVNQSGTYTVTVTYACTSTATASVTVDFTSPVIDNFVVNDINCNGGNDGSIIANISGGTQPLSFIWSSGQTTSTITGLTAGTYTLTVTDLNGCSTIGSITVNEPTALLVNITGVDAGCTGQNTGTATANVNGGTPNYSYNWNTGATTSQITNLSPGVYTVIVTDQNNCTVTADITINGLASPTVAINASPALIVCSGTPVTLSTVITGNVSYLWNTGATTSGIIVMNAGNYTITVTETNGCTATNQVTITVDQLPDASITGPSSLCANGQPYQVPACNGCTYLWSDNCAGLITAPTSPTTVVNWSSATPPCNISVVITSQNAACVSNNSIAVNKCCSNGQWCELNDINASDINLSCSGLIINNTITSQNFIINGTLTIDINLNIVGCEILLGQNARIFVRSGNQLRIGNNSYLHACNEMWFGIETEDEFAQVSIDQSRIEDALNAGYALNQGEFDITNSVFDRNLHSLNLNNGQYLSSTIEGNTFESSAALSPNPFGISFTEKHIVLDGVDNLAIGSTLAGNDFLNNAQYSIFMTYSYVTITGNRFLNNYGSPMGSAIYTDKLSKVIISQNDFFSSIVAMRINRSDATITFNNMYTPGIGVLTQLCSRMILTITDNFIYDPVRAGIINFYNHPCIQTIHRNYISVASNASNTIQGIVVAEFSPQQTGSVYDIEQNTIINVSKGIWLYNLYEPKVKNYNGVNLVNTSNLIETAGVELSNCYKSTVKYTTVVGNSQGNELSSGVKIDGSQLSAIQCNNVQDVGLGLYWLGNTMKSYMAGNHMTDCFDHVRLEFNPGLGSQGIPAGVLASYPDGLPLDNRWLGTHLGYETYAKNNSNVQNSTKFFVRAGIPFEPGNNDNDGTSFPSLINTLPFFTGNDYCFYISPDLIHDNEEELRLATDSIQYDPGQENERWIAKEFLYKRLSEDSALVQNDPVLQQAKDSLDQTNIGELKAINDSINVMLSDSVYQADSLAKAMKIDEIDIRNSAMYAFWDPEYIEQFVNELYLVIVARGVNTIDSIQESALRYIATLCPYKYGHAVFQTRVLVAYIDGEFVSYPNSCPLEGGQERVLANKLPAKFFTGNLFPNPNSGIMSYQYTLPENETQAILKIMDLTGREISRFELQGNKSEISIFQNALQQGIYQYRVISVNNETLDIGKIIIVK